MCGLFGIVNTKPKKFDWATFCIMGQRNDSRGGDSCGIFIDGQVEYGTVGNDKLFGNYFLKSELLEKVDKCQIAFGHCRKTSPGMVTGEKQAQPVVIRKKATNEILMVVTHNGTIWNYEELAKKYIPDINITGMSDTQVMARIFFYKGYDVLGEYQGAAVFCIVDYRKKDENGFPQVLFWKGQSKASEYPVTAEPKDERPLEFVLYNGSLYFSSLGELFPALLRGTKVYYTMFANTLIQFVPGDEDKCLVEVKKFDRTKMVQSKSANTYNYASHYGNYNNNYSRGSSSSSSSKKTESEQTFYDGVLFSTSTENTYKRKGKIVHGKAIIKASGQFQKEESKDTTVVWFYNGIALDLDRGRQYFKFLEYLRKKADLSIEEFCKTFENPIRFLSFDKLFFKENVLMKATGVTECELYTGPFHMIGNANGTNYKDGKRDFGNIYTESDYKVPFIRYNKEEKDRIELTKFREECISLMS